MPCDLPQLRDKPRVAHRREAGHAQLYIPLETIGKGKIKQLCCFVRTDSICTAKFCLPDNRVLLTMRPFILCLMTIFCTTSATPFPQNDLGSSPLVALGGSATTDAENTETPGIGNPGTSGIGDTSISGIGNPNIFGTGYTNILGVGTDTQSNPVNSFSSSGYTPPLAMSPPEAEARYVLIHIGPVHPVDYYAVRHVRD